MTAVQRRMFVVLLTAALVVTLLFIIIFAEKQEELYLPLRKCRDINVPVRREQCPPTSKHRSMCHPPSEHLTNYTKLPSEAVEKLRYFVLFAGHARSGSSIVGAVIDAHPHAVLANEYFFPRWMAIKPELFPNRWFVFSQLYDRQRRIVAHDGKTELKGYSLYIKGSHMGSYDRWVNVIGDKSGAYTTYMYMKDPDRFMEILHDIRILVGVPVKFIQVVRNPFDVIATHCIYRMGGAKLRANLAASPNMTLQPKQTAVDCEVEQHHMEVQALHSMSEVHHLDMYQVYAEDLVKDPEDEIRKLCQFLELRCDRKYLRNTAAAIFPTPTNSRYRVDWTEKQINRVFQIIDKFPHLSRRYTKVF